MLDKLSGFNEGRVGGASRPVSKTIHFLSYPFRSLGKMPSLPCYEEDAQAYPATSIPRVGGASRPVSLKIIHLLSVTSRAVKIFLRLLYQPFTNWIILYVDCLFS